MRKSNLILNLSACFSVALLLGGYSAVFQDSLGTLLKNPSLTRNNGKPTEEEHPPVLSEPVNQSLVDQPSPNVNPEEVYISPETGTATLMQVRTDALPPPSVSQPAEGLDPEDVYISPETGTATLMQVRTDTLPTPSVSQPSEDVNPEDVYISPETGTATLMQARTDTQPPPAMSQPPEGVNTEDIHVSAETGVATVTQVQGNTQQAPTENLPPEVNPGDIYVAPESGISSLIRASP